MEFLRERIVLLCALCISLGGVASLIIAILSNGLNSELLDMAGIAIPILMLIFHIAGSLLDKDF